MSTRIVYKGFINPDASAEAIAALTSVFKGDKLKAEEVFFAGEYTLQSVASESEAQLFLPRFTKLGLVCELVEDGGYGGFEDLDDEPAAFVAMVSCPGCGCRQVAADVCRDCGHSFVIKRVEKTSNLPPPPSRPDPEKYVKPLPTFSLGGIPLLSPRMLVLLIVIGLGAFSISSGGLFGDPENPVMMIVHGIMKSDPKEVAKTMTYNPESGENPYAKRLESLNVDQKKFSQATGVKGGTIEASEVSSKIAENKMLAHSIDSATERSANSAGNTEQDQKIEAATTENNTGQAPKIEATTIEDL